MATRFDSRHKPMASTGWMPKLGLGRKSWANRSMKFSELFYSIQGEGQLIGIPSVFFRTSFCNLRCIWCDTPYTSWQPENKEISVEESVATILGFNCQHTVITGGEPFIQTEDLISLCHLLTERGQHITIETNATVFAEVEANLISMSPKLENSSPPADNRYFGQHQRERINRSVIQRFLARYSCQVKFVVDSPEDLTEIQDLQAEIEIPHETIVLMPQGVRPDQIQDKQTWLIEICKTHGYRYSPRLHLDIWGNRRGV